MDPYQRRNAGNGVYNGHYFTDRARGRRSGLIIGGRRLGDGDDESQNAPQARLNYEFPVSSFQPIGLGHPEVKRKHEYVVNALADDEPNVSTSKSVKISRTCSFMSTLFKEGIYSDVCIEFTAPHFISNKIMKLHKNIICQSAYFEALFNASWKEANQEVIKITITDRNITERSIDILFESFYTSNLNYDKNDEDLISLLATARMFTADEVADLIAKELFSIVTINNVIYSYYSFTSYGFTTEEYGLFEYMLRNFSYWYDQKTESFIQNVMKIMDQSLFEQLVSHEDFIVKDEFMLYELIKKWTVESLKEREDYDCFKIWNRPDQTPFLLTPDGEPYVNLFKNVRLSNIMLDSNSLRALKSENIIPFDWIEEAGATNLAQMMVISNGTDGSAFKSYRVGTFHSNEAIFVDKLVNYFGIHLRFKWTSGILTVHRFRHENETMFHHGTCSLQIRITFYSPKGQNRKECNKVSVVEKVISENETLNLLIRDAEEEKEIKYASDLAAVHTLITHSSHAGSFQQPASLPFYNKHFPRIPIKVFPTIIGIDLLYLSGPQKK